MTGREIKKIVQQTKERTTGGEELRGSAKNGTLLTTVLE